MAGAVTNRERIPSDHMEANEAQELQEQHEHASEGHLKPVGFTMSVLAVLVAVVTVLGHRTHTEAVLNQAKASDMWNLYQAKKIRQNDTALVSDLLTVVGLRDAAAAKKISDGYNSHQEKWNEDLKEEQAEALKLQDEVALAERRANRFDLGEALLEIGLVVTSITLLTRRRGYWAFGGVFGIAGLVVAAMAFLVH
jgi:hypothetical protein